MQAPVELDLSELVEQLPEGDYKATIVDVESKVGKSSNAPYLRWQLTVVDHPEPKYNGKAIWTSTPLTGKSVFRLAQLHRAATNGEKLDPKMRTYDPRPILGKAVGITVVNSHDEQGNPNGFSEVKSIRAI